MSSHSASRASGAYGACYRRDRAAPFSLYRLRVLESLAPHHLFVDHCDNERCRPHTWSHNSAPVLLAIGSGLKVTPAPSPDELRQTPAPRCRHELGVIRRVSGTDGCTDHVRRNAHGVPGSTESFSGAQSTWCIAARPPLRPLASISLSSHPASNPLPRCPRPRQHPSPVQLFKVHRTC